MLQRIQSVWLLIATIFIFLTLRFPFYSGVLTSDNAYHELNGTFTFVLNLITILLGSLCFVNIFFFKKRKIQMRLCITAIILELALAGMYFNEMQLFAKGALNLTSMFHLLVVGTLIFAYKGIRADERLIQESDRLR